MSGVLPKVQAHIVAHFDVIDLVEAAAAHYVYSFTGSGLLFWERVVKAWDGLPKDSRWFIRRIVHTALDRGKALQADGVTLIEPVPQPLDVLVAVWALAKGEALG